MKVCEKVQKKGVTSYNEVADELVQEFSDPRNMSPTDQVRANDNLMIYYNRSSDPTGFNFDQSIPQFGINYDQNKQLKGLVLTRFPRGYSAYVFPKSEQIPITSMCNI